MPSDSHQMFADGTADHHLCLYCELARYTFSSAAVINLPLLFSPHFPSLLPAPSRTSYLSSTAPPTCFAMGFLCLNLSQTARREWGMPLIPAL